MGKTKIRAVFSDLGNVVLRFCPRNERLWQLAQLANPGRFGQPGTLSLCSLERAAFNASLQQSEILDFSRPGEDAAWRMDVGQVSHGEFYRAFLAAVGCSEGDFPPARFWMAYSADLVAVHPVANLLRQLQHRGTKIIAATNTEMWPTDLVWRQTGLRFDGEVYSWRVGHKKPRREFYEACRATAREALSEPTLDYPACVLIDDIAANCDSIRRLGGHAIRFKASACPLTLAWQLQKLRQQLSELKLL
ncbi:MAG: hypothetical protein G01um101431_383 [Parcubacteria group bacterium Gr01-1014_31]|nr:MAG: hypothetical protein G01um101431_383 [Parcubacteria group bacterium Gr01-1014_31]